MNREKNREKTNLSYSYRERRFGCSSRFLFEAKISSLAGVLGISNRIKTI
jgi:hypothetical protein